MNTCENVEITLSSLIDCEAEAVELPPALDHLVACDACRRFYCDARALDDGVLRATGSTEADRTADQLWERIRSKALAPTPRARSTRRRSGWTAWAAVAASLFVVAIGIWLVTARVGPERQPVTSAAHATAPAADYIEVVIGNGESRMSERRFVELTAELMQADQRYHEKMHEVLELIMNRSRGAEGGERNAFGDGDLRLVVDGAEKSPAEHEDGDRKRL